MVRMRRQSYILAVVWVAVLGAVTAGKVNSPPRMIKQPPTDELLFKVAQQNKESDKPFIIECEAEAQPDPQYRWVKNGKKFEWQAYDNRMLRQPGRGTLVITSPRDEDLGQYQCFAENEFGIATSNSVFVRKAELNSFKDDVAKTVEANEGEPFALQCEAPDGWPKPTVNWLIQQSVDGSIVSINSSRMTLDPEGTLWFSNVTRDDASDDFYYACSATSVFRNEYKIGNRVLLDVKQTGINPVQNKHEITRQYVTRKNEVALRGKRVEMFCIFGGTPLPEVTWKKDGQRIDWNDRITQGHYGKSLIIRHANFEDAGSYTCDVTNGAGAAQSYSINLKILATPYFTVEPEIQNAAEGEEVTFRCEAAGNPEPTIQWIHNGKPIHQAEINQRRTVQNNAIKIVNLVKSDTGNYGCNATNSLGYVYKDVYLNVLALPPEITEPPRKEATVEGKNVTMRCRVFGAPKPQVKWIHNTLELTGGHYTVQPSGDLEIEKASFGDAGDYTCFAINKFGNKTAKGSLVVREQTRITQGPENYEIPAGNSATFRCNANHDNKLDLTIEWWKNGQQIDFDKETRFIKTNDNSLQIAKAIELDSGEYTCVARTQLDEDTASASLIVEDVPNAPEIIGVDCRERHAQIHWTSRGDQRTAISHHTIEYNTSFTPQTWDVAKDSVPGQEYTWVVDMSPWANYTFRVVSYNKIGRSLPSGHSETCTTQPAVPDKNPENVVAQGNEPDNLVIKWTPMPEIDHNGPNFQYRVSWKRNIPGAVWESKDIYEWRQDNLVIKGQPTFVQYLVKVGAINQQGEANVAPEEVIGWSGEDRPTDAPTNLTLIAVIDYHSAILAWNNVSVESVRGHFKGYKIQTWTEKEGEQSPREQSVLPGVTSTLFTLFKPASKNYARVLAYNVHFNGPASNTIDFDTPEGVPTPVQSLDVYPLGSSAFLLTWKKPLEPNGVLTGYRVYYEEVKATLVGEKREYDPHIIDPKITRMKMAGLKPNTKYRISISATTKVGEGGEYFVEKTTLDDVYHKPATPGFAWSTEPSQDGLARVRVRWEPNLEGHPGTHFFTQYRIKGETEWIDAPMEKNKDYQEIAGLDPDAVYEFRVVAVDGHFFTESQTQEIDTEGVEGPIKVPNENMANAGWFIAMMLALAVILILFTIVCIMRRNRGGKYDVHDRELANGRRDYPDEGGFHEYSQPLDNKSAGRQSVSSANKPGVESDTDSMAEYGDGDTGLNEDGSFIGQYGRKGL